MTCFGTFHPQRPCLARRRSSSPLLVRNIETLLTRKISGPRLTKAMMICRSSYETKVFNQIPGAQAKETFFTRNFKLKKLNLPSTNPILWRSPRKRHNSLTRLLIWKAKTEVFKRNRWKITKLTLIRTTQCESKDSKLNTLRDLRS